MTLSSIIVDDEHNCRNNLKLMLEEFCPDIDVVGLADSAEAARKLIQEKSPDVVFLDVMMPNVDGFGLLSSLPERNFSVVFTTAYNEYALKAIKHNAVEYLEKPINIDDLLETVEKLKKIHERPNQNNEGLREILNEALQIENYRQTPIATRNGYIIVQSKDIIHLEATEGYTKIFLSDNRHYMSCKNIKKYEEYLNPNMFFRVHKSHIINFGCHLVEFNRTEGNIAVMSNDKKIPISRRKLPEFLLKINAL